MHCICHLDKIPNPYSIQQPHATDASRQAGMLCSLGCMCADINLDMRGGLVWQALRSVGSGCATQTDVDFVWQDVQSMVIRDMVSKDNLRPDGRGLIDSRPASYQVTSLGMGSIS